MPSMYLSGDFIDYFEIDERYIGFYLADVSGHGVSSAFVTVRIKSYITNMVMNYQEEKGSLILNPAALIEKMNTDLLFEKLEKHATIIYGIIDIKENKMIFSNAGQFPYPVLRSEGKSKFLETKGLPIGLIEYAKYKNNEINIPDDFFLVITSDGILELFPQKELSSKEDFLKQLVTETGFGINTLIEKSGIDSFETLPDDITILLIRRRKNE
jgi:serine phosphatase RsbU (regulator of sigma subunit)